MFRVFILLPLRTVILDRSALLSRLGRPESSLSGPQLLRQMILSPREVKDCNIGFWEMNSIQELIMSADALSSFNKGSREQAIQVIWQINASATKIKTKPDAVHDRAGRHGGIVGSV